MIIDLVPLKNKSVNTIEINCDYLFNMEMLSNTDIMEPLKIHIEGTITNDILDGYLLNVKVTGIMKLPCSITLEPVSVPAEIEIAGNLEELLQEIEENHKKIENSIDILPILWENILMEIPMKVTSPNACSKQIEGDGWKLVTEESQEIKNPALEKLKDLL